MDFNATQAKPDLANQVSNAVPATKEDSSQAFKTFIGEAAKVVVFAAFVLYVLGFIIWHVHLGKYGISAVSFLQTEYVAAALCYVALVVLISVPPAVLLQAWVKKRKGEEPNVLDLLMVLWFFLLLVVNALYFPRSGAASLAEVYTEISNKPIVTLVLIFTLLPQFAFKIIFRSKPTNSRIVKLIMARDWFSSCVFLVGIYQLFRNPNVDTRFVSYTLVFALLVYSAIVIRDDIRRKFDIATKLLLGLFFCMALIANVHRFGSSQFGLIPNSVGGGKPEMVLFELQSAHIGLADLLHIRRTNSAPSVTNEFVGPVAVILRSDKDVFFINPSGTNSTASSCAQQIKSEFIEATAFLK